MVFYNILFIMYKDHITFLKTRHSVFVIKRNGKNKILVKYFLIMNQKILIQINQTKIMNTIKILVFKAITDMG